MNQFSEQNRKYAVIFDMDGVLINSMPEQHESWEYPAEKRRLRVPTPQEVVGLGGSSPEVFIKKHWLEDRGFQPNAWSEDYIRSFGEEKEKNFKSLLVEKFAVMEGAVKMIETLLNAGYRVGVGSASPRTSVDWALKESGIMQILKSYEHTTTVSSDEVENSKPFGDIFKRAGENLGCECDNCLVIEDAVFGVIAATRARMRCIAFRSWGHEECKYEGEYKCKTENKIIKYKAFDIVKHLNEITSERVRKWFEGISETERHS